MSDLIYICPMCRAESTREDLANHNNECYSCGHGWNMDWLSRAKDQPEDSA